MYRAANPANTPAEELLELAKIYPKHVILDLFGKAEAPTFETPKMELNDIKLECMDGLPTTVLRSKPQPTTWTKSTNRSNTLPTGDPTNTGYHCTPGPDTT